MSASSADALPEGEEWTYEPKWDGYRAIVTVAGGEAKLTSRRGNDLTERFRDAARAAERGLRSADAVVDGEIAALDDNGRSSFSLLQQGTGTLALVLFDVLEIEGEPVIHLPLAERREKLEALVDTRKGGIFVSPHFDDGKALLTAATRPGARGRRREEARLPVSARPAEHWTGAR